MVLKKCALGRTISLAAPFASHNVLSGRKGSSQRYIVLPGQLKGAAWRNLVRWKHIERSHSRGALRRGWRGGKLAVQARLGRLLPGAFKTVLNVGGKLKPLTLALQIFLERQQRWLRHALAKAACWAALLAGLSIVAANTWAVPAINRRLLPKVTQQAAAILQREVEVGTVRWLSPPGVSGLMPVASLGPVRVGRGPVEGSSACVEEVLLGVDAWRSILQREVVLTLAFRGVQADLVQGHNLSWFGYPDDTSPSARDFLPGLGASTPPPPAQPPQLGGGGTGTGGGAGAYGAELDSHSSRNASGKKGAGALGQPGPAAQSSFLERFSQLLIQCAEQAEAQQAQQAHHDQTPQMQLLGLGGDTAAWTPKLDAFKHRSSPAEERSGSAVTASRSFEERQKKDAPAAAAARPPGVKTGVKGINASQPATLSAPPTSGKERSAGPPAAQSTPPSSAEQLPPRSTGAGTAQRGQRGYSSVKNAQPRNADPVARATQVAVSGGTTLAGQHVGVRSSSCDASPGGLGAEGQQAQRTPSAQRVQSSTDTPAAEQLEEEPGNDLIKVRRHLKGMRAHRRLARSTPLAQPLAQRQFDSSLLSSTKQAVPLAQDKGQDTVAFPKHDSHPETLPAASQHGGGVLRAGEDVPLAVHPQALEAGTDAEQEASPSDAEPSVQAPPPGPAALLQGRRQPLGDTPGLPLQQQLYRAVPSWLDAQPFGGAHQDTPAASGLPADASKSAGAAGAGGRAAGVEDTAGRDEGVVGRGEVQPAPGGSLWGAPPAFAVQEGVAGVAGHSAAASEAAAAWRALPPAQRRELLQLLRPGRADGGKQAGAVRESLFPESELGRRQAFADVVTDPAVLRRKGGSSGLKLRQRRLPVPSTHMPQIPATPSLPAPSLQALPLRQFGLTSTENGSPTLLSGSSRGQEGSQEEATSAGPSSRTQGPSSEEGPGLVAQEEAAGPEAVGVVDQPPVDPGGGKAGVPSRTARPHFLHPGYYSSLVGPKYTPAGPEALAASRAKQQGRIREVLRAALHAALSRLELPSVMVGSMSLERGTLLAHMAGEEVPRRVDGIYATATLGSGYDRIEAQLVGTPHERKPSSSRLTMLNPHANRNLRHVTGVAATRALEAQQAQRDAGDNGSAGQQSRTAAPSSKGDASSGRVGGSTALAAGSTDSSQQYSGKPTGGVLRVKLQLNGLSQGFHPAEGKVPDMTVAIGGDALHGPLIERVIELPMDIYDGRTSGELVIRSHNPATWKFPEFQGRVAVRDGRFHFWDASDDITADMDLLFERDRMYIHNAVGSFGAVHMTLTGDLDLDPSTGRYRLSATVPGVDVNQLRATLGVRPLPLPVAGAVGGMLHITGPLEKPVFSGTVHAVRPTAAMLEDTEPSPALDAVLAEQQAVGASDKIPLQSAGAVFTLDTAKETLVLHSLHAEPVGGGQLFGSGSMLVSPAAESDPGAVRIKAEGVDLPTESLAARYLPADFRIPPSLVLGKANLTASMRGSHLAPTIDVAFQLPEAPAQGSVQLTRDAMRGTLSAPSADASGVLFLDPPSHEEVKAAVTQAQALRLAKPRPTSCDADAVLRGVDVVPLTSDEQALRQLQQSGQPLRLKVNGRAKISGKVSAGEAANTSTPEGGWAFDGNLGLEGVRLNQLQLFKHLAGTLQASERGVNIQAKGERSDEVLNLHLPLPLLPGSSVPAPAPTSAALPPPPAATAALPATQPRRPAADQLHPFWLPAPPTPARLEGESTSQTDATTALSGQAGNSMGGGDTLPAGGRLLLRGGQLLMAANIDSQGSQLDLKVQNLRLDELELASLRGEVHEVSCALNLQAQTGRGKVHLVHPRYSGLLGESLSGGFRWERDVVRLEKVVAQQERSRYEVQGEYALPPNARIPSSAAELARQQAQQQAGAAAGGRWRVQVNVPGAELQEIIPAARLLQTATSLTPAEYERAKRAFLDAVKTTSIHAQDLKLQLLSCMEKLGSYGPEGDEPPAAGGKGEAVGAEQKGASGDGGAGTGMVQGAAPLPGLQELQGQWSGSVQAYGGGGGPTSVEYDVKGGSWHWGHHYTLDSLLANGSYHSQEGLNLQEFTLRSGEAKLSMRGSLLNDKQDATILLNDFPMHTLRPLFRAMPALEHAAPAVAAAPPKPIPSPLPLGMVSSMIGRAGSGLRLNAGAVPTDSPINGLLYLSGKLGGSQAAPTGEVALRLYDAAIGSTRLSQAQAEARLNDQLQLSFHVDVSPADGHRTSGHLRASGTVPLGSTLPNQQQESGRPPLPLPPPPAGPASIASSALRKDGALDVRVDVRDGGMAILTSVLPDLHWQHGNADVHFRVSGSLESPSVSGRASINRATLDCPLLRYPLTSVGGEVRLEGGKLVVEGMEARAGRRGSIRLKGSLPLSDDQVVGREGAGGQPPGTGAASKLVAEVQGLELRLKNMYTGQYDASLSITSSLARPTLAGSMRFSHGNIFLLPAGGVGDATSAGSAARSSPAFPGAQGVVSAVGGSSRGGRWGRGQWHGLLRPSPARSRTLPSRSAP